MRLSMPHTGCGLNKLGGSKVQVLIRDVSWSTNKEIMGFLMPSKEPQRANQFSFDSFDAAVAGETLNDSESLTSLASAQRALKNLFQWVTRGTPPGSQELQGLPQPTWQLAYEFRSVKIISDVVCREFVQKRRPPHYQQLIPASLVLPVKLRSTRCPMEATGEKSR